MKIGTVNRDFVVCEKLLEFLQLISSMQSTKWQLSIYSDLRQDSPGWDSKAELEDSEEIVLAMLELAPKPRVSPISVTLVTWPGIHRGKAAINRHAKDREVFEIFFKTWGPEVEVIINSIH